MMQIEIAIFEKRNKKTLTFKQNLQLKADSIATLEGPFGKIQE